MVFLAAGMLACLTISKSEDLSERFYAVSEDQCVLDGDSKSCSSITTYLRPYMQQDLDPGAPLL